jgi:thiamine kinase-like enzyme
MACPELIPIVTDLLRSAGLMADGLCLSVITGGGNNQVFLAKVGESRHIVKRYYRHAGDTRDRLGAEYALLSYAVELGLSVTPKPIGRDAVNKVGIYEFIEGRKLTTDELKESHVMAAAEFVANLNSFGAVPTALPLASDSCFSLEDYLKSLDSRIGRLINITGETDTDRGAQALACEILAAWAAQRIKLSSANLPLLNQAERCVSPSDFGFHNALLKPDGSISFIDFEYAGWDDPAKMVGDFFCQPAVPVPFEFFDRFLARATVSFRHPELLRVRTRLLLPSLRLKWCCIMLAEFLPDTARRRQFADPTHSTEQRKQIQLDKTTKFFKSRLE